MLAAGVAEFVLLMVELAVPALLVVEPVQSLLVQKHELAPVVVCRPEMIVLFGSF